VVAAAYVAAPADMPAADVAAAHVPAVMAVLVV